MNLGQLKDKVRRLMGDESGTILTDDFLLDWINEGELDIVKKTECLEASTSWAASTSSQTYALPSNFMYAKRVSLDGVALKAVTMEDADFITGAIDEDTYTFPAAAGTYYIWNSNLYISAQSSNTGNVVLHYIKYPTELSTDTTDLSIPRHMQDDLIRYVCAKCRERLDEMDEARFAQADYNAEVTESAAIENWQTKDSYPAVRLAYGDY